MDVTIRTQPPYHVAYLRHIGAYGTPDITALWEVLKRWSHVHATASAPHNMIGVSHDDPKITPPHLCRYDVCVEFDRDTLPGGDLGVQTIPGGLYACTRFIDAVENITAAWQWIFAEWLPANGYERDARPCYELYRSDVACMPDPGILACEICVPITTRSKRPAAGTTATRPGWLRAPDRN